MIISDLHIHSNCSDGFWPPKEVVLQAKLRGLKQIALTDHNTIRGLNEAEEEARHAGITFVNGVEINAACHYEGEFFQNHILAYNFDKEKLGIILPGIIEMHNDLFEEIIHNLRKLIEKNTFNHPEIRFRKDLRPEMINKYAIMKEELQKRYLRDVSNEEIDLLQKKKILHPEIIARFIKDNIIEDGDEFVKKEPAVWKKLLLAELPEIFGLITNDRYYTETENVLKEIHDAGGIAIIAHPFLDYPLYNEKKKQIYDKMLSELALTHKINGLEMSFYVPKGFSEKEHEEFNRKAKEFCAKHKLAVTMGSDCHGPKKGDENKIYMGRWGSETEQNL